VRISACGHFGRTTRARSRCRRRSSVRLAAWEGGWGGVGHRRQFARKVLPRCDLFTGAGTWGQNGRGGVVPRVSSPSAPRPSSHGVTSPAGTSVSAPIAPTVSALSPQHLLVVCGTDESQSRQKAPHYLCRWTGRRPLCRRVGSRSGR
jgi:hypothetical protein